MLYTTVAINEREKTIDILLSVLANKHIYIYISSSRSVDSRADIKTKDWWEIWYERGYVMIFLSCTTLAQENISGNYNDIYIYIWEPRASKGSDKKNAMSWCFEIYFWYCEHVLYHYYILFLIYRHWRNGSGMLWSFYHVLPWHKKTFLEITMWYRLRKVPEKGVIYMFRKHVI
jgi:hypothetical protein